MFRKPLQPPFGPQGHSLKPGRRCRGAPCAANVTRSDIVMALALLYRGYADPRTRRILHARAPTGLIKHTSILGWRHFHRSRLQSVYCNIAGREYAPREDISRMPAASLQGRALAVKNRTKFAADRDAVCRSRSRAYQCAWRSRGTNRCDRRQRFQFRANICDGVTRCGHTPGTM